MARWKRPDLNTPARPLLPPVRGERQTARWLAARRGMVTASDLSAILQVPGAHRSPFALWWAKKLGWSGASSEEQEWGHRLEPAIARRFAEDNPDLRVITPPASLWGHRTLDWAGCTPDRLVICRRGCVHPLELKSDQHLSRWPDDAPPEVYRVQLAWQAAILCWPASGYTGYLAALVGRRYRAYFCEFEPAEITDMIKRAAAFRDLLDGDEPPEVDAHPTTLETQHHLPFEPTESRVVDDDVAAEWTAACDAYIEARQRKRLAETRLRDHMGDAGRALDGDGRLIATRQVYDRVSYTVGASRIDRIMTIRGKKEDTADGG